ncbi:isoprenylcysteine carboxylmethyltransferase family protein [soil metagenome]
MLKRSIVFSYGVLCYVISLGVLAWTAGFLGHFLVPRSIDSPARGDVVVGVAIDVALVLAFALQHSVMARPAFKRWWTRVIPPAAERSTYLLATNVVLVLLFALWRPLGGTIWALEGTPAIVLRSLYGLGWAVLVASTFFIDHFDLFGLRQVWLQLRSKEYENVAFKIAGPYRVVRHPIYVGWLLIVWATPTMTASHLFFAGATTAYILVAIKLEEKDLVDGLGEAYRQYQLDVPMLIPRARSTRDHSS